MLESTIWNCEFLLSLLLLMWLLLACLRCAHSVPRWRTAITFHEHHHQPSRDAEYPTEKKIEFPIIYHLFGNFHGIFEFTTVQINQAWIEIIAFALANEIVFYFPFCVLLLHVFFPAVPVLVSRIQKKIHFCSRTDERAEKKECATRRETSEKSSILNFQYMLSSIGQMQCQKQSTHGER